MDAREGFHRQHGVKELRSGASLGLRNLDTHDAQLEQAVDELSRNERLIVHLSDSRANFAVREFVHAVPEQRLVFV